MKGMPTSDLNSSFHHYTFLLAYSGSSLLTDPFFSFKNHVLPDILFSKGLALPFWNPLLQLLLSSRLRKEGRRLSRRDSQLRQKKKQEDS